MVPVHGPGSRRRPHHAAGAQTRRAQRTRHRAVGDSRCRTSDHEARGDRAPGRDRARVAHASDRPAGEGGCDPQPRLRAPLVRGGRRDALRRARPRRRGTRLLLAHHAAAARAERRAGDAARGHVHPRCVGKHDGDAGGHRQGSDRAHARPAPSRRPVQHRVFRERERAALGACTAQHARERRGGKVVPRESSGGRRHRDARRPPPRALGAPRSGVSPDVRLSHRRLRRRRGEHPARGEGGARRRPLLRLRHRLERQPLSHRRDRRARRRDVGDRDPARQRPRHARGAPAVRRDRLAGAGGHRHRLERPAGDRRLPGEDARSLRRPGDRRRGPLHEAGERNGVRDGTDRHAKRALPRARGASRDRAAPRRAGPHLGAPPHSRVVRRHAHRRRRRSRASREADHGAGARISAGEPVHLVRGR